jgi:hypothetical protein
MKWFSGGKVKWFSCGKVVGLQKAEQSYHVTQKIYSWIPQIIKTQIFQQIQYMNVHSSTSRVAKG